MRRQVELLTALLAATQRAPAPPVIVQAVPPPHPEPLAPSAPKVPVQRESKLMTAAIAYLQAHPDAVTLAGRDLEATISIDGRTISYKTWNEAKKKL